jgi:hypothetical protein
MYRRINPPIETTIASDRFKFLVPLLFVGLIALFVADQYFPLVNSNPFFFVVLALVFLPAGPYVAGYFNDRLPSYLKWLWPLMILCVASELVISLGVFLNGRLDNTAPQTITATIRKKSIIPGKSNVYELTVDSWRQDRDTERFDVSKSFFDTHNVGGTLSVPVHRGRFGVPWYEKASLR